MISKHVSYKEGVVSFTALRLGIENEPTGYHRANMEVLAEKVFEPLREWVGKPIKINSFYRGPELNKAIGGSSIAEVEMKKIEKINNQINIAKYNVGY